VLLRSEMKNTEILAGIIFRTSHTQRKKIAQTRITGCRYSRLMLAMKLPEPTQPKELWVTHSKVQLRALSSFRDFMWMRNLNLWVVHCLMFIALRLEL